MVMLSSFVRSLTSWKPLTLLRLRWSFKRERRLRQLILIEVVSTMGYMMRMDIILDCLLDICRIMALMLDIQYQELHNRMGLWKEEIVRFLIWCDACWFILLCQNFCLVRLWELQLIFWIKYLVSLFLKLYMSHGQERNQICATSISKAVKQRWALIICSLRSLIPRPSVVSSLVIVWDQKVLGFITSRTPLELKIQIELSILRRILVQLNGLERLYLGRNVLLSLFSLLLLLWLVLWLTKIQ